MIEGRLGAHDSHHFELKLDYAIDPTARRNRYRVDAFVFVPQSLGISPETYTREQFFGDVHAYIRFKTPEKTISALLDGRNAKSPLTRLAAAAAEGAVAAATMKRQDELAHELRLLGCLVRARVRDRTRGLLAQVKALDDRDAAPTLKVQDLATAATSLAEDAALILSAYRALRDGFVRPDLPHLLRETYTATDEYMSLVVETHLTQLIAAIDGAPTLAADMTEARRVLVDGSLAETRHREEAGYMTVLRADGDNEHFVYRRGVLKKLVTSVLFLEVAKEHDRRSSNIAAAGAAAVAMLVAAAAAVFAQQRYGVNTLPFVLALVLSYVVKDRIKESLRQFFASRLAHWFADHSVRILDPVTGVAIGRCQESFRFLPTGAAPAEVFARRHADANSPTEVASKREHILHYQKTVSIRGDAVGAHHGRLRDISDIIRFSLSSFLARADDPTKKWAQLSPDGDRVQTLPLPRVYHINVVVQLRAVGKNAAPVLERVRVVVDRNGIRRIEEA